MIKLTSDRPVRLSDGEGEGGDGETGANLQIT